MDEKKELRLKRHRRILLRTIGTSSRPRLVLHRSLKHLSAQLVDDEKNKTLFSLSTQNKQIRQKFPFCGNVKSAGLFGEVFAQQAKEKGITKIVFDRGGLLYHGRIKTFAEAVRKGGLEF
jgi:large subunit ribosomal protein L18